MKNESGRAAGGFSHLAPGWACAGVYREGPAVPRLPGTPAAPITFTSYPCEQAVVSGADPILGAPHLAP